MMDSYTSIHEVEHLTPALPRTLAKNERMKGMNFSRIETIEGLHVSSPECLRHPTIVLSQRIPATDGEEGGG